VHRLRSSARALAEIIGNDEFERLQDVWASARNRRRWSVAFPIVETYRLVDQPRARDVFSAQVFRRLYQYQSAILRPLDDEARSEISDLEIIHKHAPNSWIAIEDEVAMAEASEIPRDVVKSIERDLVGALEGETEERRSRIKKRTAWLANRFATERRIAERLVCDECGFDPRTLADSAGIKARSCFDVHHLSPIEEGKRYTTIADFALLCPTCHRIAHLKIAAERQAKFDVQVKSDRPAPQGIHGSPRFDPKRL
jgi:5-methylcytosine-specific restriction protein A